MRNNRKAALCAAALALALLCGCAAQQPAQATAETAVTGSALAEAPAQGTDTPTGDYLLTVDGYGVTEDEYLLFLRDQKAITANYYWENYQLQPDAAFWHTEIDGQTPLDYAKGNALTALIRAKEKLLLAAEQDVTAYKAYPAMMQDMQQENADRAAKKKNGEVFYGVTEFTPFTYYQYLTDNSSSELESVLSDLCTPTEEELQALYQEYSTVLSLGTTYRYKIETADGETEERTQNTNSIAKADTLTEDLIYSYFTSMQPGQSFAYAYGGHSAVVTLLDVQDEGVQSFEDAKDSLKVFYAREKLEEWIAQRTENAVVAIDHARYDELEMP